MTMLRVDLYVAFGRNDVPMRELAAAFRLGLRFDLRVVAAALLPLVVLGGISFVDPFRSTLARRVWLTALGVFSAALTAFYVSDFLHFRYLGQRLNATVLGFLGDAKISGVMVWESYPVLRIVLAAGAAIAGCVWVLQRIFRHFEADVQLPPKPVRIAWRVAAIFGALVAIFGRVGQYPLRWSDAFALGNATSAQLALNPVESFLSSLSFRTPAFELERVRSHYPAMSAYLGVARPDVSRLVFDRTIPARRDATTVVRQPNVVLILCESFSAYKSSMWGNALDTTPFFNALTKEGVFFDNCFTPHFGTARGVWASITGTPDVSPVETASRNPAMVDQHTIIRDFEGYEKLYFLGGSTSWANIRGLLTNNIPDLQLFEEDSYDSPKIDVWGISDKNLFLEADKVLQRQTKPFFAVIQTADNHRPYTIPKEDLAEFKKVDLPDATVKQHGFESLAELNAFRYTDFSFQKFFEAARRSAYFENTLFVFIGDHGIGGDAGAAFPPSWTENHLTRYHVPLLFYAPKFLPPQRVHSVASMVDVLPTIAGLANISYRNRTFGRDLLQRQQVDGGASNVAFIIDHNDKTIGLVRQQHYGVERLGSDAHRMVWADFAAKQGASDPTAAADYRTLAQAFYETSRYLLLHNPKNLPAPVSVFTTAVSR